MTATAPTSAAEQWVRILNPMPAGTPRLFCLPHSGGGIAVFHRWPKLLKSAAEVCAIQLPGRDGRIAERPYGTMQDLVRALQAVILPYLDRPFAFFGHSMGALVAFALTRALAGRAKPSHLFLSAARPPHLPALVPLLHDMPDEQLVAALSALDGMPAQVLKLPELLQLFLPIIRADLRVCETYQAAEVAPLCVPITVLGGEHDPRASRDELKSWRMHTTEEFRARIFSGGHFYLKQYEEQVVCLIADLLMGATSRR